jgi:hypothetical protein
MPAASARLLHPSTLRFACVQSSTAQDGSMCTCGRKEKNCRRIDATLLSAQRFFIACTPQILPPVHIFESKSMCLDLPERLRPTRRQLRLAVPSRSHPTGRQHRYKRCPPPPPNNCLFTPNGSIHAALVPFLFSYLP